MNANLVRGLFTKRALRRAEARRPSPADLFQAWHWLCQSAAEPWR